MKIKRKELTSKDLDRVCKEWNLPKLPFQEEKEWLSSQNHGHFYMPPSWNGLIFNKK